MGDAEYTFAQARARLEDIVGQVRKKDVSLEHSLDLLEEGVRLAGVCTEQIDQSEWRAASEELPDETPEQAGAEALEDLSPMAALDPLEASAGEEEEAPTQQ